MISIPQLLIIAVIVVLLFGTNKLRSLGSDLGESIKGFKKAIGDDKEDKSSQAEKMSHDADFEPKNLTEKPTVESSEKSESKNKEQV
ncbi:twin-arginine translocase TatA/TatE family subunit [Xenorhabdus szentirmaii]|uniref:Sec-independent protein translocase protein TatA n=2 Tax=Xenorhabdus szentirmaii TaxID=290112 RepID=W1IUZ5_9GAMM|nr:MULTISPECIES: twin-arginine translocase TatA/TatE family subunit [Xenorhabdus]MBD2781981.1 twin-arginine translocase TatA/TatE family subunit [Xenorhabdus sp. 38]MBD2791121.1 twin-arginine translocase TatA/TatE family subunit [Xenorhabdus sp. CUL]MBD2799591.1 twin-arginine translocase TatA/TatE family subunit [Xenorhabdus sp. M]MBD2806805.1 twin-arginine translocase TatA/TatE family subunit [Xenorhabdus sp. ZM]MBD2821026.1 twin-arginine translocase TatA/TatE family subunit [Xenorhabdus sp. 